MKTGLLKLAKRQVRTLREEEEAHLNGGELYPKDPVARVDHLVGDVPLLGT